MKKKLHGADYKNHIVVLFSRDHKFSVQNINPKTSLTFPLQQFGSIG